MLGGLHLRRASEASDVALIMCSVPIYQLWPTLGCFVTGLMLSALKSLCTGWYHIAYNEKVYPGVDSSRRRPTSATRSGTLGGHTQTPPIYTIDQSSLVWILEYVRPCCWLFRILFLLEFKTLPMWERTNKQALANTICLFQKLPSSLLILAFDFNCANSIKTLHNIYWPK